MAEAAKPLAAVATVAEEGSLLDRILKEGRLAPTEEERETAKQWVEALVEQYPFLARYFTLLPWRRRYWFHVFDAVGLGLMCARKIES